MDSSGPVLWELPSSGESPAPADTPVIEKTGDPARVEEEFDLFAPGAFEKYNAEHQESIYRTSQMLAQSYNNGT